MGEFVSDFTIPMIKFYYQGSLVTLEGTHSPTLAFATFQQISRMLHMDAIDSCHAISMLSYPALSPQIFTIDQPALTHTTEPPLNRDIFPPDIAKILHTYASVFSTPMTYPPTDPIITIYT